MSEEKQRRRNHGLRYFFAFICALTFVWKLISGFHDISIAADGLHCVQKVLPPQFTEFWDTSDKLKKRNRWNRAAEMFIQEKISDQDRDAVFAKLQSACSAYLMVTTIFTPSLDHKKDTVARGILIPNWALWDHEPANSKDRTFSMLFWGIVTILLVIDFRKLRHAFIWSNQHRT
jgi:hypothetical protein